MTECEHKFRLRVDPTYKICDICKVKEMYVGLMDNEVPELEIEGGRLVMWVHERTMNPSPYMEIHSKYEGSTSIDRETLIKMRNFIDAFLEMTK